MAESVTEKLECDLVMRGGITSGIVYPRAIAKLAETYRFRAIGGTSAGAIAAAATGAAAYGVRQGKDRFQTDVKDLPRDLGTALQGKTRLERLFQPQAETARIFRVLMASLGHTNTAATIAAVLKALCLNYWGYALIGALCALAPLLAFALAANLDEVSLSALMILGLLPALIFALLATLAGASRDVLTEIPKNRYGLCSGSSNNVPDEAGVLPLTDWLNEYFQTLAGKERDAPPLTFSELWGTGDDTAERDIDLVLMTTNITRGISQRLPFLEGSWGQLFFKEDEFRKLFPSSVVDHLCRCGAKIRAGGGNAPTPNKGNVDARGYVPLPKAADLPILLGARMSLSFPFLLSAVPLYAANVADARSDGTIPLQCCWFSDGGLTSNFPIHFFDTPLPRWPTFGINLVPASVSLAETEDGVTLSRLPEGGKDPWSYIYMPSTNASGIATAARFNAFEGRQGGKPSLAGFFGALFDTARNWADTELMAMPGYRDRIVHVALAKDEGGMNLSMDHGTIRRIGDRGEKAGELLSARFAPDPGPDPQSGKPIVLTWDNHRWIRYRSLMAGLELYVLRFRDAWYSGHYRRLINRPRLRAPSYKFANLPQQGFVRMATKQVLAAAGAWKRACRQTLTFDRYDKKTAGRSPRPKPALRMMPLGSNDPRAERPDE